MLTPRQLRMARAALDLSLHRLGQCVGKSDMALSRYENGDLSAMSVQTVLEIEAFFTTAGVYFGPKDGVCYGQNVFHQERWLGLACYQMLKEAGIAPSSRDLLDAYDRAMGQEEIPGDK
jgi:transcriptional regulator with XRE-family HTH domain